MTRSGTFILREHRQGQRAMERGGRIHLPWLRQSPQAAINDPAVREALCELNTTLRRMNERMERALSREPFSIHPEVAERMEKADG